VSPVNPILEAALDYARRGWPVVPCYEPRDGGCSCRKGKACQSPGKHPRTKHGINDATTDEATIRSWFEQFPSANVAVVTGNGLAVLDVDSRHGGRGQLRTLFAKYAYLPTGPNVETGGGGMHLYFVADGEHRSRVIAPGPELKSAGASVVAPPSLHISGAQYRWVSPPDSLPLPTLPPWLASIAEPSTINVPTGTSPIPERQRHNTLLRYAGALRRAGASESAILAMLMAENASRCSPPLPEEELRNIAKSVANYPPHGSDGSTVSAQTLSPLGESLGGNTSLKFISGLELLNLTRTRSTGSPSPGLPRGRSLNSQERSREHARRRSRPILQGPFSMAPISSASQLSGLA
jgi:hypothetical protein